MKTRAKKRVGVGLGGVALAFGVAFTALLDPARGAAIEEIDRNRERGDHESGQGGEKIER